MDSVAEILKNIKLRKEKILILGAGVSGFAVLELCLKAGIIVEVWDDSKRDDYLKKESTKKGLSYYESKGARFLFSEDEKTLDTKVSLVVTSPGIPPWSKMFSVTGIDSILRISELELGLLLFRQSESKHIVVTGSNGKSTTSSIINFLINSLGYKSCLCGNIGQSPLYFINENFEPDCSIKYLVVEASSYQLESFSSYRPDVAVMLNLSENHLERHKTMQSYLLAKKQLIKFCTEKDFLIINEDQECKNIFCDGFKGKISTFGFNQSSDLFINNDALALIYNSKVTSLYKSSDGLLFGAHNLLNLAASFLACQVLGFRLEELAKSARKFGGLEHRIEVFKTKNNFLACNDSKSTTVMSTLVACKAIKNTYPNNKIILLIGGREKKGSDWSSLRNYILDNIPSFYETWFFGESAESVKSNFSNLNINVKTFFTLNEATKELKNILNIDLIALLSPGGTSFDEFRDFEDRGGFFKKAMME